MVGSKIYQYQRTSPLPPGYILLYQLPDPPPPMLVWTLNSHGPGITGPKFRAYKKEEKKDKKIQLIQIVFNAIYLFFLVRLICDTFVQDISF